MQLKTGELRREQVLDVTPQALVALLRSEHPAHFTGMPADARVKRAYYDGHADCFRLVLESESFEPSLPGSMLKHFQVTVKSEPVQPNAAVQASGEGGGQAGG